VFAPLPLPHARAARGGRGGARGGVRRGRRGAFLRAARPVIGEEAYNRVLAAAAAITHNVAGESPIKEFNVLAQLRATTFLIHVHGAGHDNFEVVRGNMEFTILSVYMADLRYGTIRGYQRKGDYQAAKALNDLNRLKNAHPEYILQERRYFGPATERGSLACALLHISQTKGRTKKDPARFKHETDFPHHLMFPPEELDPKTLTNDQVDARDSFNMYIYGFPLCWGDTLSDMFQCRFLPNSLFPGLQFPLLGRDTMTTATEEEAKKSLPPDLPGQQPQPLAVQIPNFSCGRDFADAVYKRNRDYFAHTGTLDLVVSAQVVDGLENFDYVSGPWFLEAHLRPKKPRQATARVLEEEEEEQEEVVNQEEEEDDDDEEDGQDLENVGDGQPRYDPQDANREGHLYHFLPTAPILACKKWLDFVARACDSAEAEGTMFRADHIAIHHDSVTNFAFHCRINYIIVYDAYAERIIVKELTQSRVHKASGVYCVHGLDTQVVPPPKDSWLDSEALQKAKHVVVVLKLGGAAPPRELGEPFPMQVLFYHARYILDVSHPYSQMHIPAYYVQTTSLRGDEVTAFVYDLEQLMDGEPCALREAVSSWNVVEAAQVGHYKALFKSDDRGNDPAIPVPFGQCLTFAHTTPASARELKRAFNDSFRCLDVDIFVGDRVMTAALFPHVSTLDFLGPTEPGKAHLYLPFIKHIHNEEGYDDGFLYSIISTSTGDFCNAMSHQFPVYPMSYQPYSTLYLDPHTSHHNHLILADMGNDRFAGLTLERLLAVLSNDLRHVSVATTNRQIWDDHIAALDRAYAKWNFYKSFDPVHVSLVQRAIKSMNSVNPFETNPIVSHPYEGLHRDLLLPNFKYTRRSGGFHGPTSDGNDANKDDSDKDSLTGSESEMEMRRAFEEPSSDLPSDIL